MDIFKGCGEHSGSRAAGMYSHLLLTASTLESVSIEMGTAFARCSSESAVSGELGPIYTGTW